MRDQQRSDSNTRRLSHQPSAASESFNAASIVNVVLQTRNTPEKIEMYRSDKERVLDQINQELQNPNVLPRRREELLSSRENITSVLIELDRRLSVQQTTQRQTPPATIRRPRPPLPERVSGNIPVKTADPSSDSRVVRRLEPNLVRQVSAEVRESAQRATQNIKTPTPTPAPATRVIRTETPTMAMPPSRTAPAASGSHLRMAGGIVKKVTVPQQIIDFVNTRIKSEGVCALAILLLQEIQSPEDQKLRSQAFIPLLQNRLEALKKLPKTFQPEATLSKAQEKATAEALLKALGISQLDPKRSEAIEMNRRANEVVQRAETSFAKYETTLQQLQTLQSQTFPSGVLQEFGQLQRRLGEPMRVLEGVSSVDFNTHGEIQRALETVVASEEGLKRIHERISALKDIASRENAKHSLEQLIAELKGEITRLEGELSQAQTSLAREQAERMDLQIKMLEMKIERQRKDPRLAEHSQETIANAEGLLKRMKDKARDIKARTTSLLYPRSESARLKADEMVILEVLDQQTSQVFERDQVRLQEAHDRISELETYLEELQENRRDLEGRVEQLVGGIIASSSIPLVSQQFSDDIDPIERAAYVVSEIHAQQQRDLEQRTAALKEAEETLLNRERALAAVQATSAANQETLRAETTKIEQLKREMEELQRSRHELQRIVSAAEERRNQAQKSIEERTGAFERTTALAAEASERCSQLSEEIVRLTAQREALLKEHSAYQQQQSAVQGTFSQVEQETKRVRAELDRLRSEIASLTIQKSQLSTAISEAEQQKALTLKASADAEQSRANQVRLLEQAKAQQAAVLAEIKTLEGRKSSLQGTQEEIDRRAAHEKSALQTTGQELSKARAELDRLKGELSQLHGEKEGLEKNLGVQKGELQKQIEVQQRELMELQTRFQKGTGAVQQLETRKSSIEDEIRQLESRRTALHGAQQEIDRKSTEHRSALETAGQELSRTRGDLERLKGELARLKSEKDQLDKTVPGLLKEKEGLERTVGLKRKEAEQSQQTIAKLQDSLSSILEQIATHQSELEGLQTRFLNATDASEQAEARRAKAEIAAAQMEQQKGSLEKTLSGFLSKATEIISAGKSELKDPKALIEHREKLFGAWQGAFEQLVVLQQRGAILEVKEPALLETIGKLKKRITSLEQIKSQKRLSDSRKELEKTQKGAENFARFRKEELPKIAGLQQSQQGWEGQLESLNRAVYNRFNAKIAATEMDEASRKIVQDLLERMSVDLQIFSQIMSERDRLRRMLVDSGKKQVELTRENATFQVQMGTLADKVKTLEEERAMLRAKNSQLEGKVREFESNPMFQGIKKLSQSGEFGRTDIMRAYSEEDLEDPENT